MSNLGPVSPAHSQADPHAVDGSPQGRLAQAMGDLQVQDVPAGAGAAGHSPAAAAAVGGGGAAGGDAQAAVMAPEGAAMAVAPPKLPAAAAAPVGQNRHLPARGGPALAAHAAPDNNRAAALPQQLTGDGVDTPAPSAPRRVAAKFQPSSTAIAEESEDDYSDDDVKA